MGYQSLKIRTLISEIFSVEGVLLKKGMPLVMRKYSTKIVSPTIQNCLIYLDNGKKYLEDFDQHIVNKKLLYDNSI
jgi:hypothetical protein